ncbi:MAG: hypothetical protein M8467_19315, partial [Anaerolineae bacterium]|nr:hypothetical protein [Anaerolineae bacterium]
MVDGITMNHVGSIFAAVIGKDHIVAICGFTGALSVLAAGPPIDGPASVALGPNNDSFDTLYFTNYAVMNPEQPQPGVLKVVLGWPPWIQH